MTEFVIDGMLRASVKSPAPLATARARHRRQVPCGTDLYRQLHQDAAAMAGQLMARKAQVFPHHAIDRFIGECARRGLAETTRKKYRDVLDPFGDMVEHKFTSEIDKEDCERYLDRYVNHAKATLALYVTVLCQFGAYCESEGLAKTDFAARLKRPRRLPPEELEVVMVDGDDVRAMLASCVDWQERLCVAVVFYMAIRRTAAANVRRRDVDLENGYMRFTEKRKRITKPIPDELLALLRRADELGQWLSPDEYLIPNRKPWLVKSPARRGSKIIYETVVRVAGRAGVKSHVHALRAAFAVEFDEANPGNSFALQEYLGHASYDTTKRHYLRRRDKRQAMEVARGISLFPVLPANAVIPPAGFEPAFQPNPDEQSGSPVTQDISGDTP